MFRLLQFSLYFVLTLLLLGGKVFAQKVFAQDEFYSEYVMEYKIDTSGITTVTQEINIINNQNDVIPTTYTQIIKHMDVYDIEEGGDKSSINLDIKEDEGVTEITAEFKNPNIGKGKTSTVVLEYKTKDIASQVGDIWNVLIPKIEIPDQTKKYIIDLYIPKAFGPKIFTSPSPLKITEEDDFEIYRFDTNLLKSTGITASFGSYQTLNYKLNYNLENTSSFAVHKEIALPPDVQNKQQVKYTSLLPKPADIRVDKDGNYLASYKLQPNSTLNIELIGSARISGQQIFPENGGSFSEIPVEITNNYTSADKYWEVNAPEITKIASSLFINDGTVAENAENIYNYILKTLEYDFETLNKEFLERNGALKTLTEDTLVACMEFTDVFITLARANGIPARELNGYAFSGEGLNAPLSINLRGGDVLHSWPEFYDPKFGWVAVDPTWGSTTGTDYFSKLDTNHFVFVVKGSDSEFPLPAGAYKLEDNERQVEVAIANTTNEDFLEDLKLYKTYTLNPVDYFNKKQNYIISNVGSISLFNVNDQIIVLPPFESQKIKLDKDSTRITFEYFNGEKKVKNLAISEGKPESFTSMEYTYLILFGVALLLCTIVYYLIIRLKNQNKVSYLRDLLRRDQDQ